jgi:hypothetical protein
LAGANVVDDDRWLTYDDVARARGTSRDAAIRWVQRHRLRRQPGNDGRVRVFVPPNVLDSAPRQSRPRTDTPSAPPAEAAAFQAALDAIHEAHAGEVAALRVANASEIARLAEALGRTEIQIEHLRETLAAALADRTASEARADEARADLVAAQADGTTVAIEAKRLRSELEDAEERLARYRQEDAARKGRGLLVRLRDALRGQ